MVFRIYVPCCLDEGDAVFLDRFPWWLRLIADEPVGDVDVVLQVFGGGVLVQDWADGDAEVRIPGQLLGPVLESVDVGEGDDLAALQDQEPVIDAGLAAGGQPEVAGHQAGADDGRLLFGVQKLAELHPKTICAGRREGRA